MIGKKKKNTAPAVEDATPLSSGSGEPRSMFRYFIPALGLSILLIGALVAGQAWLSADKAKQKLDYSSKLLATSLQKYVTAVVKGKVDLIKVLAEQPHTRKAVLKGDLTMLNLGRDLKARLPDVISVRLLPANGWDDNRVQKALGGSYAAADIYQRIVSKGKAVPVEALKPPTGQPHFLVAMPVEDKEQLIGVLFATFPVKLIAERFKNLQSQDFGIRLEQTTGMPLATAGNAAGKDQDGSLSVPGTLWRITYVNRAEAALSPLILAALAGTAIVLLLLVLLWTYSRLRKDYLSDIGMTVTLVDATLKRLGSTSKQPRLVESAPAIEMLVRYAQATHAASNKAEYRENKAGKPQITVGDLEKRETEVPRMTADQLPATIFRKNVIRGLSNIDLNADIAKAIGLVVGSMVQETGGESLLVGRDNRSTSDDYAAALTAGVLASGCDVIDLGVVPQPLLSFGCKILPTSSAVMVTAGHSPADFNGFKIIIDGKPLMQAQLAEIRERILSGDQKTGIGQLTTKDISGEYVRAITEDVQLVEGMKVVLDCGNGITGTLGVRLLERLGCEVIPLFCESDSSYPNHFADPSNIENLGPLGIEVQAQEAALGIALDMDGDALAIVDEKGQPIGADALVMKLGSDIIQRHPGADIIYDVACSANLAANILGSGGRPVMWKTGHSTMQQKIVDSGALLAGEMSGHIYIQERWFGFDDGLYAAARLLEILSLESVSASEAFEDYRSGYSTPLMQIEVAEGKAEQIVSALRQNNGFSGADIVDLDGLRVEYTDCWGLIRASHTQPALIFRFEGADREGLTKIQEEFRFLLGQVAPDLPLPF